MEIQLDEVYEKYEKLRVAKSVISSEQTLKKRLVALQSKLSQAEAEAKRVRLNLNFQGSHYNRLRAKQRKFPWTMKVIRQVA